MLDCVQRKLDVAKLLISAIANNIVSAGPRNVMFIRLEAQVSSLSVINRKLDIAVSNVASRKGVVW